MSSGSIDRATTGCKGLDKMLHGGFLHGRNILLSGGAGIGKTTLAVQFICEGARNDETSMYVTLEESKEKLYADMHELHLDIAELEKTGNFLLIGGPLAVITQSMKNVNANVHHLIKEIEEIVKEKNVKRLVLDSLNLFLMLLETEEERRTALAMLCNTLSSLGVTALLLTETKEGSLELSTYGIEEFITDGVIALYRVRQGAKFIPGIAIKKMRGTNHDKEIRLFKITENGVVVYPDQTMFTVI